MLLRPNESICIQGAFFLSYAGGSKRAATWERVQRSGGGGAGAHAHYKQSSKDKHGLGLHFFPSFSSSFGLEI